MGAVILAGRMEAREGARKAGRQGGREKGRQGRRKAGRERGSMDAVILAGRQAEREYGCCYPCREIGREGVLVLSSLQ